SGLPRAWISHRLDNARYVTAPAAAKMNTPGTNAVREDAKSGTAAKGSMEPRNAAHISTDRWAMARRLIVETIRSRAHAAPNQNPTSTGATNRGHDSARTWA